MMNTQSGAVLPHLRRLFCADASEGSDRQLLERFLSHRDEAAFTALVRRHGPMVLGVCRRVLTNLHDADDAFQATFLVLVKKAATLGQPERLGNWLYGVAYRTALKARGQNACRNSRTQPLTDVAVTSKVAELIWQELRPILDEELQRLPEKYRIPIVMCFLEGVSKRAAANQLGWPEGTLSTRLHHARQVLRERLTRRGLTLSAGAVAVALSQGMGPAAVPALLTKSTVAAASIVAAGGATALLPVTVAALTEGVLRAMFISKVKIVATILLAVGFLAVGISQAITGSHAVPVRGKQADTAVPPSTTPQLPPPSGSVNDRHAKALDPDQETSKGSGGIHILGGFGIDRLATTKSVQEDLKVNEETAKKIKDAIDKVREDNKDDIAKLRNRTISKEERAKIEKTLHEASRKALKDILDAGQMKRLQQISRQVKFIGVFQMEDVQAALKLTIDQKTRLKAISDKFEQEIHELLVADEQDDAKFAAVRKAAMTESVNTLTDDQNNVYQELIGKPFPSK